MSSEHDADRRATTVRKFVQLGRIDVPKASDVLADTLRERILSGDFPEDTALPPERDLVTQAQMSRTTVREALRILEAQGFVKLKSGRAGGAFVRLPGEESVASTVGMVIQGRRIRMETLLETREAIEPMLARLAATRHTADDLARIVAANDAMKRSTGSLSGFLQANVDWHVGVAEASHNELLVGLMSALSKAIYLSTENRSFIDENIRKATLRAHEAVTKAIRDGDEVAAARRMSKHVHAYASAVKLVEDRVEIDIPD